MSDENNKKASGTVYNFKNEWKHRLEAHQKANGEWQVGGKTQSDTLDLLPETFVNLLKDTISHMEDSGLPTVKPKVYNTDKRENQHG